MSQRYSGGLITANPTTPTTTSASGVWTLEQQFQNSANWPGSLQLISRSVRTRASASGYFSRTFTSVGNRQIWTWSGWVKRGTLSTQQRLFSCNNANSVQTHLSYTATTDTFTFQFANATVLVTSQVFRDPSAWYHVVMAVDTTQATASNRAKLYINGSQVTAFSTASYMAQNATSDFNNNVQHTISSASGTIEFLDGYLTEIKFIDGQALDASYFGTTDSNGVWQPVAYSGAYGTNGYYLNFSDNSNNTATTIGKDYSGNGNNWTPNNISVTAGVTYDSMLDVPTPYADGGNGRGNYATLNPIGYITAAEAGTRATITNGNLSSAYTTGVTAASIATMSVNDTSSIGKWYWEATLVNAGCDYGIMNDNSQNTATRYSVSVNSTGGINVDASAVQSGLASFSVGDVIGVAVDTTAWTVQFYRNGSAYGSAATISATARTYQLYPFIACASSVNHHSAHLNFGQRPFVYTPPTGFKALNTQNLPDATIKNGAQYFAASLFTGTSGNVTVSNAVNGISFQPDFLWFKARSNAQGHSNVDSVRGANKLLQTNLTNAESTLTNPPTFNADGFTSTTDIHTNGYTYVAWQWNAGGSTVSNTNGSITSSVRANPTAGFSIVTYTGTGANATVGHGLGVAPKMIIIKARSRIDDWIVYHESVGNTKYLLLDTTAAASALSTAAWNNTSPTSTVFTIGTQSNGNTASSTNVAYCFAEVAGFSKMGSYTGNASTDGPFVYCGFRPRFIMLKNASAVSDWLLFDTARNTYNLVDADLRANLSQAEGTQLSTNQPIDALSNGFKVRGSGANGNGSGNTIIYAAFAENPFKLSRAR